MPKLSEIAADPVGQSNVIFFFLFAAFFVFITARGELPTYISLIL